MRHSHYISLLVAPALILCARAEDTAKPDGTAAAKPLKALLITGGGYHDYEKQKVILTEGVSARANVEWTIDMKEDQGNKLPLQYANEEWAKGYDVIVHNECYAKFSDKAAVEKIAAQHSDHPVGVVFIHCAMHTFRDVRKESKAWYDLIGLQSDHHGAHFPFVVKVLKSDHPIMAGFPDGWTTPKGELYITKITSGTPLASGSKADAKGADEKDQVCVWTNEIGKAKVFGTTIGHYNEEMEAKEFLDMMARGILWSAGKLEKDGKPSAGYEAQKKAAVEAPK